MFRLLSLLLVGVFGSMHCASANAEVYGFNCEKIQNLVEAKIQCSNTQPENCYELQLTKDTLEYREYNQGDLTENFYAGVGKTSNDEYQYHFSTLHTIVSYADSKLISIFDDLASREPIAFPFAKCQNLTENFAVSRPLKSETDNTDALYSEIPDWCVNLPHSSESTFVCGVGSSLNNFIAKDVATLDTQRQIADILCSEISSIEDKEKGESIVRNQVQSNLFQFKSIDSVTQKIGTKFVHYQLGEFEKNAKNICAPIPAKDSWADQSTSDDIICLTATMDGKWETRSKFLKYVQEAKRRGLNCRVGEVSKFVKRCSGSKSSWHNCTATTVNEGVEIEAQFENGQPNKQVTLTHQKGKFIGLYKFGPEGGPYGNGTFIHPNGDKYVGEFKNKTMTGEAAFFFTNGDKYVGEFKDEKINGQGTYFYNDGAIYIGEFKDRKLHGQGTYTWADGSKYVGEFKDDKRNGQGTYSYANGHVEEGIWKDGKLQYARSLTPSSSATQIASSSTAKSNTPTSAELTAAQKEAERLRKELAALKTQQQQEQQTISNDKKLPTITIASATTTGAQGVIRGRVNDNTGVAELRVDGQKIAFDSDGNFSATTYVPEGGTNVNIEAIDLAGLSSTMSVMVDRATSQTASISFDRLNPLKRKALPNKNAIALIIGIGTYENIIDAAYADKDALVFRDYAKEKLGIPSNQIKTLINKEADIGEVLLGIRKWIRRSTKPDKTDVYVFYAGHGITTAAGEAYILPYDGRPEVDLLDSTALLQKELFAEIDKAKPRTVTIFLDACYTGKARFVQLLLDEGYGRRC